MIFLSTLSLRRATVNGAGLSSCFVNFYPRSPCGERRVHYDNYNLHCVISIHALLAESDAVTATLGMAGFHFYPRSPCGERLRGHLRSVPKLLFLSTLSLRRATAIGRRGRAARGNFYPRSPCGERPGCPPCLWRGEHISIHALLAESDRAAWPKWPSMQHFYPRSPCGERQLPHQVAGH